MMEQKQNVMTLFIMGFLSMLIIACSSSGDIELTHYINSIKSRPPKPIEPIPDFKQLPKFTYPEDEIRRSPFRPMLPKQQADLFAPDIKRPKQPLEFFPLDALQFVGLLEQGHDVWALILQPSGIITRVKVGDYMGQNYGQVVAIKAHSMKVEEKININGKWEKKGITINMRTPK